MTAPDALFGAVAAPRRALGAHQSPSGGKDEWLTPPDLIAALGPFDLDPCAPIARPWPTAAQHFTIADDGLRQPWHGLVWLNPPYSRLSTWLARLAAHGTGIALVSARTETAAWHEHVWPHADLLLFLRGRLHFHHVSGRRAAANSGAPSALVAYGATAAARLRAYPGPGQLVTCERPTPTPTATSVVDPERVR